MEPQPEDLFPIDACELLPTPAKRSEPEAQKLREKFSETFGRRAFHMTAEEAESNLAKRKKEKRTKRKLNLRERLKEESRQKKEQGIVLPYKMSEEKKRLRAETQAFLEKRFARGQRIAIDMSFTQKQGLKEVRSLAFQVCQSYFSMKTAPVDVAIHLTSYEGPVFVELEKMRADLWVCGRHPRLLEEVFADELDNLVYLSPDAEEVLETIDPSKIYVIGGIIDNTEESFVSKSRAFGLKVKSVKLDLDSVPNIGRYRKSLNVNAVFDILVQSIALGSVKEGIKAGLPSRYFDEKKAPGIPRFPKTKRSKAENQKSDEVQDTKEEVKEEKKEISKEAQSSVEVSQTTKEELSDGRKILSEEAKTQEKSSD